MKRIVTLLLAVFAVSGSALAGRPWAPGAETKGSTSGGGFKFPPLVLRLGASFASTNIEERIKDINLKGLQLEAAVRLVKSPVGEKTSFLLDIPLVFSLLTGDGVWNDNSVILLGRGIPTARLAHELSNGMVVSPFFGFGAGSNLNISGGISDDFQLVWVYRLGADLMFTKRFGAGLAFTRSTLGSYQTYQWIQDEFGGYTKYSETKIALKEISLSLIIQL